MIYGILRKRWCVSFVCIIVVRLSKVYTCSNGARLIEIILYRLGPRKNTPFEFVLKKNIACPWNKFSRCHSKRTLQTSYVQFYVELGALANIDFARLMYFNRNLTRIPKRYILIIFRTFVPSTKQKKKSQRYNIYRPIVHCVYYILRGASTRKQ